MNKQLQNCTPSFSLNFLWVNIKESILPKFILGLVIGILFSIDDYINENTQFYIYNFIGSIFCTFLVWSGSSFIGSNIDNILDWEKNGVKKGLILILSNVLYISVSVMGAIYLLSIIEGHQIPIKYYINSLVLSVLIATIINLIFITRSIFNFWKNIKYENEVLKKENLKSQLETLKNQINPHFLFNSLNTLTSIIDSSPKIAIEYTQNLSKVYRNILQSKDKDLVTLESEMAFLDAYCYLFKIRFEEKLIFDFNIPYTHHFKLLPSLVLQILIENTIKHNIIGENHPLKVEIYVENELLVVKNNFQPKIVSIESENTGLKNIADRYKLLMEKEIEIIQNENHFLVKVPLA